MIVEFHSQKHKQFIGKICKVSLQGVILEKEYEKLFGIITYAEKIYEYCQVKGKYEMNLIFIDEPPINKMGETFYCVKEIGNGVFGDLHWFTLNQLVICD